MSLVTMLILVVLGYGMLVSTAVSSRVENALKAQTSAFETADSAIEQAREKIRQCLAGTLSPGGTFGCNTRKTLSQLLNTAGGSGLRDSTSLTSFPNTTATTNGTSNTPFIASDSTLLSPASFQVFLTNDPADGVTNATDGAIGTPGHNRVTLTSFASGPNNIGYAVVQAVVEAPLEGLDDLFQATLVLPGPTVEFYAPDSQPYGIGNGGCKATIGVTSNTARQAVYDAIPPNRKNDTRNYNDGCSPATLGVYNFLARQPNPYDSATSANPPVPAGMPTANDNLITISWYNNYLLPMLKAVATFRSENDAGFNLGTATNPQIVYIEGDFDVGTADGYGILVVTGNLTLHGNTSYTGLVLNIGAGHTTVSGGGNGSVTGTVVVANTSPWAGNAQYVSTPYYNANGGGTSSWGLGNNLINNIPFIALTAPRRLSFMQLR